MAQDQNKPTDDKHLSERKLTPIRKWRYFLTIGSCRFSSSLPQAGGEGIFPENSGEGVPPASQTPYSISDRNLRFSPPYLWPNQKFNTCTLLMKNQTRGQKPYSIYDQNGQNRHPVYSLFMTKTVEKPDTLGPHIPSEPTRWSTPRSGQPLKQNSFKE